MNTPTTTARLSPAHAELKKVMSSNWRTLEQPPPPTLREVLAAYKSRGDGDRELLLAMLSAKSAEDQRLAAVASLQRTLLDMAGSQSMEYYPPPPPSHIAPSYRSRAGSSGSESQSRSSSHPSHVDSESEPPRKRYRRSASPVSGESVAYSYRSYSSSRSESMEDRQQRRRERSPQSIREERSPRGQGMNIESLVSAAAAEEAQQATTGGKRKGPPA